MSLEEVWWHTEDPTPTKTRRTLLLWDHHANKKKVCWPWTLTEQIWLFTDWQGCWNSFDTAPVWGERKKQIQKLHRKQLKIIDTIQGWILFLRVLLECRRALFVLFFLRLDWRLESTKIWWSHESWNGILKKQPWHLVEGHNDNIPPPLV